MTHPDASRLFLILLLVGVGLAGNEARAATYEVAKGSKVEFTAKITGSSFVATSEALSGTIELDAAAGQLTGGQVQVAADSFKTGLGMRDNHMRDKYLEAKTYPAILFELKPGAVDAKAGTTSTVTGTFAIKKGKKSFPVKVKTTLAEGESLRVSSAFPITITDYGIPQPGFAIVKMETTIQVKLELVLTVKK